jgi:IPT/TIG domain
MDVRLTGHWEHRRRLTGHREYRRPLALLAAVICACLHVGAMAGKAGAAPLDHWWHPALADHRGHPKPFVTDVSPSAGPAAGGTAVTLAGEHFTNATRVDFGGVPAISFRIDSDEQITAIAPAGSGTVGVTVTTPAGTSRVSRTDRYTFVPPPEVTGLSPSEGPSTGGTEVTITGSNFAGATAVNFGATNAIAFIVDGETQIVATAPPGTGTVDVRVTTPGGQSVAGASDRYGYLSPAPPSPPYSPSPSPPPSAPAIPPVVVGGAPATETSNTAEPTGLVNPESEPTTAYFEYGLDLSERGPGASTNLYDQTTPVQQVGSDATDRTISAVLTGLLPNALYHIRLVATNSAGTTLGPDHTFRTAPAPPPPPPVLGQTVDAAPVSGIVFVRSPSRKFVPLTGATRIPVGAQIDALRGALKLTAATSHKGITQHGTFGGAIFTLSQSPTGANAALTTLAIVEGAFSGAPSYALCTRHAARNPIATAASSRTLQLLHASAHGKFRTSGRYSAATVRGTVWTIADRCGGTLVHDVTDSVAVRDFVLRKTIILHAGQSYLAKAPSRRG